MGNKKKLIFEIEEGKTKDCENCKFGQCKYGGNGEEYWVCLNVLDEEGLDCEKYDFSTLKFIGEDENNSEVRS